jgi:hypothetical protein
MHPCRVHQLVPLGSDDVTAMIAETPICELIVIEVVDTFLWEWQA